MVRDGALARIRVPGGILSGEQLRIIAEIATTRGNGLIDFTNRANLQLRGLRTDDAAVIGQQLAEADLLNSNPDIDRIRNITASPLAGLDESEIIDVRASVAAIDTVLRQNVASPGLSPKFSFVIDGGGCGDFTAIGHDIGFLAVEIDDVKAFVVSLAGEVTDFAIMADDLAGFVDAAITKLVAASQDRMGDCLVHKSAREWTRKLASEVGIEILAAPTGEQTACHLPIGHHAGSSSANSWFVIGIPLARLNGEQTAELASLAEMGGGTVRLTPWQSIVVPHISQEAAVQIGERAAALGFDVREPAVRIIACTGASGCTRTEADTKADARRLITILRDLPRTTASVPPTIHLSGCSRGCACPGPSDILALAAPGSANYAVHADSRPATADIEPSLLSEVGPDGLASAIDKLFGAGAQTTPDR